MKANYTPGLHAKPPYVANGASVLAEDGRVIANCLRCGDAAYLAKAGTSFPGLLAAMEELTRQITVKAEREGGLMADEKYPAIIAARAAIAKARGE